MCYAVYIGTNTKQETAAFISDQTFIYLEQLSQEKEVSGLVSKFTNDHIYYVGSYQGCSCGFAYDPTNTEEEKIDEEDKIATKSVKALLELINKITKNENLEFYCCWEGDWESAIEERTEMDIRKISLGSNYFGLVEKRFILFKQQ